MEQYSQIPLILATVFCTQNLEPMKNNNSEKEAADLTRIFDTVEYPEAYRVTYLANSLVFPAYADIKRDFGLVRAEYILLVSLAHFDELTAQEVAQISRRPRNTISRAVHRMLAEGFLERAPDPTDGRQVKLRITKSGRTMHEKIWTYIFKRQEEVFSCLNPEERETLTALLKKVALHASKDVA